MLSIWCIIAQEKSKWGNTVDEQNQEKKQQPPDQQISNPILQDSTQKEINKEPLNESQNRDQDEKDPTQIVNIDQNSIQKEIHQANEEKDKNFDDKSKAVQYSNEDSKENEQTNTNPKRLFKKNLILPSLKDILPAFDKAKTISDSIVINLCEEEKVKKKMNDIKNDILKSTTTFEQKYCIILKKSFVSVILEIVKKNTDICQPNIASKVNFFKTMELSKEMDTLSSFIDQVYDEKNDVNEVIVDVMDAYQMNQNTMLHVMTEKESFKEINIQINCESELNSKIPQDF